MRVKRRFDLLPKSEFPHCQKLAAELEVSAKTVQRDIDCMRDQLRLPIAYEPQEHTTTSPRGHWDYSRRCMATFARFTVCPPPVRNRSAPETVVAEFRARTPVGSTPPSDIKINKQRPWPNGYPAFMHVNDGRAM